MSYWKPTTRPEIPFFPALLAWVTLDLLTNNALMSFVAMLAIVLLVMKTRDPATADLVQKVRDLEDEIDRLEEKLLG
ncbi:MAG: hypothetical protein PHI63_06845 [Patescibacteria group bacterium]|nr:hypothetical protein [Patescibacteria group bacterium]